ncbi:50S ribosomal protein L11 methyltransferase [Fodinicurvata sp. EGI_FJ10296]|uniref:50S ribosomal protein L11 methyltransferase n=1 Tax=Fodinicurvata sp. EGI_FJ10296 TaxID=3231908 RepID=UPI003454AA54
MRAPIQSFAMALGSAAPVDTWRVDLAVPIDAAEAVSELLGDLGSVSMFGVDQDADLQVSVVCPEEPDRGDIGVRLAVIADAFDMAEPPFTVERVEGRDWIAETKNAFPPVEIGRFFIHGSHVERRPPPSSIGLHVDAATAFGSGEHPTTEGCLRAIEALAKRRHIHNTLDMGCGSGILAIAAAKCWATPVLAADNDGRSVQVAAENAGLNRVAHLMSAARSEGYRNPVIRRRAPYDLILANILARPLTLLARDAAGVLAPGGILVLSGLMTHQEAMVLAAHRYQGLHLIERRVIGVWSTLVLHKRADYGS